MEILCHSLPASPLRESLRHRAYGILTLFLALASAHAATAQALNVMVSTETAPPGVTVQIKLSLAKPAALYAGELALDLDPTVFGPVAAMATFSAAGDGSGFANVNGSHVDIHFQSPSATLGSAAGMPLVVITVPVLATAKPGTQATINADPSVSQWRGTGPISSVTVTPGSVTTGGSLSVSDLSPISNLAAGAVVHIHGAGFTSATTLDIAAVSVASTQLVGPQEIDATLTGPADLGGKQITVRNPGVSQVTFFAAPPAQPLPAIGDQFDGAIPLFPTVSCPAGLSEDFPELGLTHGRYALLNPNAAPVDVLLQGNVQITIPPGSAFYTEFGSFDEFGSGVQVIATAPLQMLQLTALVNGSSAQFAGYELAPFTPTGIPPLGIVGPPATNQFPQFNWVTGTAPPQPQTVTLFSSAKPVTLSALATPVAFTVSLSTESGGNWLSVSPASGTITASTARGGMGVATLTVSVNPTALLFGLGPGVYRATVTVTPLATEFQPASPAISFPVALTVTASPLVNHVIILEPFTAAPVNNLSQTVPIAPDMLPGPFSVSVVTDSGGNWLSAMPLSGTAPVQLNIAATPGNLAPGTYAGVVTVAGSGGNTFVIESTLTVNPAIGGLQLYTAGLNPVFALGPGEPPSAPQTVPVQVTCYSGPPCTVPNNVTWTTTAATHSGGNWLHASSTFNTTGPGSSVTISVDPMGLATGVYTGVVTLTSDQASPAQIPVALNVWSGPVPVLIVASYIGPAGAPGANQPAVSLTSAPFAAPVATAAFLCTTTGSANVRQTAQATTSNGGNWLSATVAIDVTGFCGISLSLDASHLDVGTYQGNVTISVQGQSLNVPVTLTIPPPVNPTGGPPELLGSVLNAASAIQGAIAPGEIITIHGGFFNGFGVFNATTFTLDNQGRVPTSLNGAEVLVNGKPAPMLYLSGTQINAIVPYEVAGQRAATVQVLFNGGSSPIWSVPVARAAPGIFTLDATGAGPSAVINQDNSVNSPSQPAARGSVIQIFATGIPVRGAVTGSITPAAAPGSTDPVSVTIGGATASILYAGPAPGEIAGLLQVNAVVSDLAPTGPAVPIVLSVSPPQGPLQPIIYASQPGATIAVQ